MWTPTPARSWCSSRPPAPPVSAGAWLPACAAYRVLPCAARTCLSLPFAAKRPSLAHALLPPPPFLASRRGAGQALRPRPHRRLAGRLHPHRTAVAARGLRRAHEGALRCAACAVLRRTSNWHSRHGGAAHACFRMQAAVLLRSRPGWCSGSQRCAPHVACFHLRPTLPAPLLPTRQVLDGEAAAALAAAAAAEPLRVGKVSGDPHLPADSAASLVGCCFRGDSSAAVAACRQLLPLAAIGAWLRWLHSATQLPCCCADAWQPVLRRRTRAARRRRRKAGGQPPRRRRWLRSLRRT